MLALRLSTTQLQHRVRRQQDCLRPVGFSSLISTFCGRLHIHYACMEVTRHRTYRPCGACLDPVTPTTHLLLHNHSPRCTKGKKTDTNYNVGQCPT